MRWKILGLWLCLAGLVWSTPVTVGSYNLGNFLSSDRLVEGVWRRNYPKPEAEKLALLEVLKAADVDVLVVQEIGEQAYFEELKQRMLLVGLDYPYSAQMCVSGSQRCLAIFSRFPFDMVAHDSVEITYEDKSRIVLRGMLEARFDNGEGQWRLYGVHLKSRYTSNAADPFSTEFRVKEATALRDIIDEDVDSGELEHYVIAGDFNDTIRSRTLRRFLKKGEQQLSVALRPADSRGEVWTQNWRAEGVYSRIDFLLVSPQLQPYVLAGSETIVDIPMASSASDHRLVKMTFDWPNE